MITCLAIDIGASSGRHIVGRKDGGKITTEEVYRFPNGMKEQEGHLVWDTEELLFHVRKGVEEALAKYPDIASLSIDTWGVDYVLLRGNESILPCHAYRDHRTEAVVGKVHEIVSFPELYRKTGCQFQPFNTVYQLYDDLLRGRLENATDLLMMPEYLMYRLTGVKSMEYTEATTTGLVSAETGEFDRSITDALGFPERLFPKLSCPGEKVGEYKGVDIVLSATHDTASAVEGIPMEGNYVYISSGTWSLLGIKTEKPLTDEKSMAANWSNEGGIGYNRYQKNIMGLWLVNRLRDELCPGKSFEEITEEARHSDFDETVDANAGRFLSPDSMKAAFDEALPVLPKDEAGYFRAAYRSLALSYRDAVCELEENTGNANLDLYVVGGGAKNTFLNELTAGATGKRVIALPIEATALGNLNVQFRRIECMKGE